MWIRLAAVLAVFGAGCGDDDACDPVANSGCDDNQACELVQDGEPTCVAAVAVVGRVFDLDNNVGIGGARVVALDANGAAMSFVATSAADGSYTLPIPIARTSAGAPAESFTIIHGWARNAHPSFAAKTCQRIRLIPKTHVRLIAGLMMIFKSLPSHTWKWASNSPPAGAVSVW